MFQEIRIGRIQPPEARRVHRAGTAEQHQRYAAGRDFSRREENGFHLPLKVRPRGGNQKDITLVMTGEQMKALRELLDGFPPAEWLTPIVARVLEGNRLPTTTRLRNEGLGISRCHVMPGAGSNSECRPQDWAAALP